MKCMAYLRRQHSWGEHYYIFHLSLPVPVPPPPAQRIVTMSSCSSAIDHRHHQTALYWGLRECFFPSLQATDGEGDGWRAHLKRMMWLATDIAGYEMVVSHCAVLRSRCCVAMRFG